MDPEFKEEDQYQQIVSPSMEDIRSRAIMLDIQAQDLESDIMLSVIIMKTLILLLQKFQKLPGFNPDFDPLREEVKYFRSILPEIEAVVNEEKERDKKLEALIQDSSGIVDDIAYYEQKIKRYIRLSNLLPVKLPEQLMHRLDFKQFISILMQVL